MAEVALDRAALQALASDTRLAILRALQARQKTVTELSRELELNKATVFKHLDKLTTAGLVNKKNDHRKWVYYHLSYKGKRLLHPGMSFALALSTAGLAFLGAGGALIGYLERLGSAGLDGPTGGGDGGNDGGMDDGGAPGGGAEPPPEPDPDPTPGAGAEGLDSELLLTISLVLLTVAIILGVTAWMLYKRRDKARAGLGAI